MDSDDEIEKERLSYRAVLEASHLFGELCAWATEYRVGLVKLWLQDVPIKDAQQVIEASAGSTINEAEARAFLANFFEIFGHGAGSLFTKLSLDLLSLDWGESSPLLTKAKTKQPKHMREEWRHRLKALMHFEYLNGVNGYGSREKNIFEVEQAFGLDANTLIDWTKKTRHPRQIMRHNLLYHLERARAEGHRIAAERQISPKAPASPIFGGDQLKCDGQNYQAWRKSLRSKRKH
jgi:hypothetical protein